MKANEILRNRRIEIGLSQAEVARRTGIPQASLCRYERGIHKLCNENAKKLCDFYNLNYKFLTGEKRMYVRKEKQPQKEEPVKVKEKETTIKEENNKEVNLKTATKEILKGMIDTTFERVYKEEQQKMEKELLRRVFKRVKKELI